MRLLQNSDAPSYEALGHEAIGMVELVGEEALQSGFARIRHLRYTTAGRVALAASPDEKIYICLRGSVEIFNHAERLHLSPGDVCIVDPGEPREIINRSKDGSELLLVMPRQTA